MDTATIRNMLDAVDALERACNTTKWGSSADHIEDALKQLVRGIVAEAQHSDHYVA